MFSDEERCASYLERLRRPHGFVCPSYEHAGNPYHQTRGRPVCSRRRHQASVTAGTTLDKTRNELMVWFEAAWHVTTVKNGLSAKTLERSLGTREQLSAALKQCEGALELESDTGLTVRITDLTSPFERLLLTHSETERHVHRARRIEESAAGRGIAEPVLEVHAHTGRQATRSARR